MKKPLQGLLVLLLCYPLGCLAFVASCGGIDWFTAKKSASLLARLHSGMAPAEVEVVVGRPPEYTVQYARDGDNEQFSHNWTVQGYRLEVIFVNDLSAQWHTFGRAPSPVERFFGWVFFWWFAPFVED